MPPGAGLRLRDGIHEIGCARERARRFPLEAFVQLAVGRPMRHHLTQRRRDIGLGRVHQHSGLNQVQDRSHDTLLPKRSIVGGRARSQCNAG
jgi:hypothetical protein